MQVAHLEPEIFIILSKIFGHSFCQGCYQDSFIFVDAFPDLFQQVVNLIFCRPDIYSGIK